MRIIVIDKLPRVTKNRKRLEQELNVKITNKKNEISLEGDPNNEYLAEKVIEALDYGIPYSEALKIKKEDKSFEIINIKEYTNQKNLVRVRGRIIGQNGKVLKTLSTLTDSSIELKENFIAIVTDTENMERLTRAIIAILKGAKHGAVYKELEHNFPKPIYDFGIKEYPIKTMKEYEKELKKLNKKL